MFIPPRYAIFDLDGTLYRTHETCLPPLYDICHKYNITLTSKDERFLLYTTTNELLDRVAPNMAQEQREHFIHDLRRRENEVVRERGRLFDNVENLLSSLAANGISMAICGIGSKEYIDTVLTHCNIKHYFKYICHRIDGLSKSQVLKNLLKETNLQPDECIMVGDSLTDLTAAKENGLPFLGVNYGYGSNDIAEANAIADDVLHLERLIYQFIVFSKIQSDIGTLKRPVIVGVNGVDTSGKTEFSIGLQKYLNTKGYSTQLIHSDDFHNLKSLRMKDSSPEGYIANAFNLTSLFDLISEIKSKSVDKQVDLLDLATDTYTNRKHYKTNDETIVIVEGVLLYRPPIDGLIDYKVFLDISFDEVIRRATLRDVPKYGKDFLQKYIERYIPAQKIYLKQFLPKKKCQLIIDNNDYNKPKYI
jgi:phosphoglycolate phosphatase